MTERLDAVGIASMLAGSIALGYYAQPRVTRDIDLVVELELADAKRIAGAFTPEFNCDVDVIRGAIARQSLFNLIHIEAVAKVHFVVRKDVAHRLDADRSSHRRESGRAVTPYQVTRHTKHVGATEVLSADVREPRVAPLKPRGVQGVGLVGGARLTFDVAVEGPVILGRSRHLGGGLFARFGVGARSPLSPEARCRRHAPLPRTRNRGGRAPLA